MLLLGVQAVIIFFLFDLQKHLFIIGDRRSTILLYFFRSSSSPLEFSIVIQCITLVLLSRWEKDRHSMGSFKLDTSRGAKRAELWRVRARNLSSLDLCSSSILLWVDRAWMSSNTCGSQGFQAKRAEFNVFISTELVRARFVYLNKL